MFNAKIYNGNKGTTSEYFTVSIYEENGEFIRATGKYFKTEKGAVRYINKNGYKLVK